MKYYSPTAKKIAQQKRYLKWIADNGPVYDPDKYPVPPEEAGPVLDDDDSGFINSSDPCLLVNVGIHKPVT